MKSFEAKPNRMRGFVYPCFYVLRDNLGRIDATIETVETAIRVFAKTYESSPLQDQFLKHIAREHGIILNHVDWQKLPHHAAYLYITSVYQQAEWFFDAIRKQHPKGTSWPGKPMNESILTYTLNCLDSRSQVNVSTWLLDLFEYYRLVRNRFAHLNVTDARLNKQLDIVLTQIDTVKSFYNTNAPNTYSDVSFEDFILFTRALKDLALQICDMARPSDDQLGQMLLALDRTEPLSVLRFSGFLNNDRRLRSALKKHLDVNYNAFLSDDLYITIKDGLLAQSG